MSQLSLIFYLFIGSFCLAEEITPCKFTDHLPSYDIPSSSRFVTSQNIIYYFTPPPVENYPIAIVCGGSSTEDSICSIIHLHRYFLQEFLDLNVGVLTVEQEGVDGNKVDTKTFMEHYTRSNRLHAHQMVIKHLKTHPPTGWNGKLIFLGVSEGGPLVTSLTIQYSKDTLATLNWSGAGDWPWQDELWTFLQKLVIDNPCCPHQLSLSDCDICLEPISSKEHYNDIINDILSNPTTHQYFLGMTYKYHADALLTQATDYTKIKTPFLVVAGVQDSIIPSVDDFVKKGQKANAPITYFRIDDMDHYVRKRPDIIERSFEWLKSQLLFQNLLY